MMQSHFDVAIHARRRRDLCTQLGGGLVLLPGNDEAPINYTDNVYPFRQDSSFLYYIGLAQPGLAALIDCDTGETTLFGDDVPVEQIVWTGPLPTMGERAAWVGVEKMAARAKLAEAVAAALAAGRTVHFPPAYRGETREQLRALGLRPEAPSVDLIRAIVAQRQYKQPEEIAEIEAAIEVSRVMHELAMRQVRPGRIEREVVAEAKALAHARGMRTAFPTIFSVRGEILHNTTSHRRMEAGQLVVHDSGVETARGYCSDITRTIPVAQRFEGVQRDIYAIVLEAQLAAIAMMRPGVEFREVHRRAGERLVEGLKALGIVRGDVQEAVAADVHTLFFQCGLGHMMGLDVHDMEGLGEEYVGYSESVRRNPAFGWRSLRMARALEPGHVMTVEPGIYFISELIDQRRAQKWREEFVDYAVLEKFVGFGGVRIEDDVLVTDDGHRVLGPPIPKTMDDVEEIAGRR